MIKFAKAIEPRRRVHANDHPFALTRLFVKSSTLDGTLTLLLRRIAPRSAVLGWVSRGNVERCSPRHRVRGWSSARHRGQGPGLSGDRRRCLEGEKVALRWRSSSRDELQWGANGSEVPEPIGSGESRLG